MCRYLLASSGDALLVGLLGTKFGRDLLTNVSFLKRHWDDDAASSNELVRRIRREAAVMLTRFGRLHVT